MTLLFSRNTREDTGKLDRQCQITPAVKRKWQWNVSKIRSSERHLSMQ